MTNSIRNQKSLPIRPAAQPSADDWNFALRERLNGVPHEDRPQPFSPPVDDGSFSIEDCGRFGFPYAASVRAVIMFAGTTGGGVGADVLRLAKREWGGMPAGFVPLFVDFASPPAGVPLKYCLTLGSAGAGTVAVRSRKELERYRTRIRQMFEAATQETMNAFDARLGVHTPAKQSMLGLIVGGAGGSGMPLTELGVDELMAAMVKLRVNKPRVSVIHIGPEISLKDVTRDPIQRLEPHIEANSAQLLEWLYQRTIVPNDQPISPPHANEPQISRIAIIDQTNQFHSLPTNRALQQMLARSLLFHLFSRAGREITEREEDQRGGGGFVADIPESTLRPTP